MYVPKHFHEDSWPEIRKIIDENSFATVISCTAGMPVATHVPLRLVEPTPGKFVLQGHMARANPHWRVLENERKALVIFAGPHSYVSPRWYQQVNVSDVELHCRAHLWETETGQRIRRAA